MADVINIGKIQADLEIDSGRLEQGLAKGREAMRRIMQEVKQLQEDFKAGGVAAAEFADRTRTLERTYADLANRMQGAYAAIGQTRNVFDVANKSIAGGFANSGRAILEFSRGIEDLQYGVHGALNNIPTFIQAMGGPAGVAGAVSLAAVGVTVLIRHWDDLMRVFGMEGTKTAAQEMEELRKKTELTADEAERLHRASEVKGKVDEVRKAKTKSEKDTEDKVTEALTNAGPQDVARGIVKNAPELLAGQVGVPQAKAMLDLARSEVPGHVDAKTGERNASELEIAQHRSKVLDAEKKYNDVMKTAAEHLASTGALPQLFPGGLKQLTDVVKKKPSDFGPGGDQLLRDLEAATPEARTKKKIGDALDKAWEGVTAGFKKDVDAQVKKNKVEKEKQDRADVKARDDERARGREWRQHNLELADTLNPGLREAARRRLDEARRSGGKEEDVAAYFATALAEHSNMTPGDAAAAAKDAVVRARGELNRTGQAGANRREDKERKDRLERADEALPGLEGLAKFNVRDALLAGASLSGVTETIMNQLKVRGLGADDAKRAAGDAVEDAAHDVRKDARNDYLKALEGMDEIRRKELLNARSEVFSTSSLTQQVQSGIGQMTEAQRHTELLGKLYSELVRLNEKPGLKIGVLN